MGFMGYINPNWSGTNDRRESISGCLFMLGWASISWNSKRQALVSQSSYESEYYALSEAVKKRVWLYLLLQ